MLTSQFAAIFQQNGARLPLCIQDFYRDARGLT